MISHSQLWSVPSFPVMGKKFNLNDYVKIDLSTSNKAISKVNDQNQLRHYVESIKNRKGAELAYGGYGEMRNLYKTSSLFSQGNTLRNIHLGIDIWAVAGTTIYCPVDARIHSLKYNDKPLDYGYTLILEHENAGLSFYILFGHLSGTGFDQLSVGQRIKRGEKLASIGASNENGAWLPHLHLQLILDIADFYGDYPGVCSEEDKAFYLKNCPNPVFLIFTENEQI